MTTEKMTKRDAFNAIIAILAASDAENAEILIDAMEHEIELLDKKRISKKPSKVQVENETYKSLIIEYLTSADSLQTIQDIQSAVPELADFSTSKMSHLLTALVKEGIIAKEYVKKKVHYTMTTSEDSNE